MKWAAPTEEHPDATFHVSNAAVRATMTTMVHLSRFAVAVSALLLCAAARILAESPSVPTRLLDEDYIGSESCRECHPDNHASWSASYHRRMTQVATPEAVLAPFEGTTPLLEGVAWNLSREEDGFHVQPIDARGKPVANKMRVALTTGSHNYQIYWLDVKGQPELGQLPLVWHLAEKRWLPRKSMFLAPPPDSIFAEGGRWPRSCIKCHTTNGTQIHPTDGRTHVAEFGIACEACHGPGAKHVALQTERKKLTPDAASALPVDTTITNPADLPHDRSTQVCGQCHGIHPQTTETKADWEVHGYSYRPGDDLSKSRDLLRGSREKNTPAIQGYLDRHPGTLTDVFWSDGQVRVSGREYNGLVESPCYQRGTMSCLSCHDLHPNKGDARPLAEWADDQLKPGMNGSNACLQCHGAYSDPEKQRAHTHHAPQSSGAECLNCHMPFTTYGLTKAIRSHTITSPNIATTLATGRPDACNQCHLDKPLGWAAERLHEWYGHDRPKLSTEHETIAASIVWSLTGDAGQRALQAWSFGWAPARAVSGTGWMPPVLSTLMQDPYDAVRFVAMRSARADPRAKDYTLDFTKTVEEQRTFVRATYLADWQRTGLSASPDQRAAVLVGADGKLDQATFKALYARIDQHVMQLME